MVTMVGVCILIGSSIDETPDSAGCLFMMNKDQYECSVRHICTAQESGSDVHQHKQALKDLEAKLVVRTPHATL